MNQPQLYRIGIYLRVSTEDQAENPEGSIKNQEQRLREFVHLKQMVGPFGEIAGVFTDAGISAKNTNRPAFQQLLAKIESHEINMVLVTELSRFTRSIRDFSNLWEYLAKHNCKFLSVRDNFDTSTSAGEFVMYLMSLCAEFERKQTADRISNAFLCRAQRGLFNGGFFPLGYEKNNEQRGGLKINPEEAELVKIIFDTFLEEETVAATTRALNAKGIRLPRTKQICCGSNANTINMDTVHNILRRKSYAGIRQFSTRDGKRGEAPAVWQPIISSEKFNMVQAILDRNRHHKRGYLSQRYPYTLSGICFCKTCGDRLSGKSAHSKGKEKFPYYEHGLATKRWAAGDKKIITCDPPRVPARIIEPLVWQEIKRFLCNEEVASQVMTIAQVMRPNDHIRADEERLRKQLLTSERQIEALAERIARLPKEVDERTFLNQMAKLQDEKRINEIKLAEHCNRPPEQTGAITYDDFAQFSANLLELMNYANNHGDIQAAIIRHLVHRINVGPTGFEINFYNGKTHVAEGLG